MFLCKKKLCVSVYMGQMQDSIAVPLLCNAFVNRINGSQKRKYGSNGIAEAKDIAVNCFTISNDHI